MCIYYASNNGVLVSVCVWVWRGLRLTEPMHSPIYIYIYIECAHAINLHNRLNSSVFLLLHMSLSQHTETPELRSNKCRWMSNEVDLYHLCTLVSIIRALNSYRHFKSWTHISDCYRTTTSLRLLPSYRRGDWRQNIHCNVIQKITRRMHVRMN